jgi:hypothetical protein
MRAPETHFKILFLAIQQLHGNGQGKICRSDAAVPYLDSLGKYLKSG